MRTKKLISTLALILSLVLAVSMLASCDLGNLFGGNSSDDEEKTDKNNSVSVKAYVYDNSMMPEDVQTMEDLDPKGWKASSKINMADGVTFEPGYHQMYYAKIENKGATSADFELFFNTKGEANPIAEYISGIVMIADGSSFNAESQSYETISTHEIDNCADYLGNKKVFATGTIPAKTTYYAVLLFRMNEDVSETFEDYTLGAKVYLGCKAKLSAVDGPVTGIGTGTGSYIDSYVSGETQIEDSETIDISGNEEYSENSETPDSDASSSYESNIYDESNTMPPYIDGNPVLQYDEPWSWSSSNYEPYSTDCGIFYAGADGVLNISYIVSSENGCDFFKVYINGTEHCRASGDDKQTLAFTVYQGDMIEFVYSKDSSVSEGSDCVHVNNIMLTRTNPTVESTSSEETTVSETETSDSDTSDIVFYDGELYYYENYSWTSTNHESPSNDSVLFYVTAPGYLYIDYRVSSEGMYDFFTLKINSTEYIRVSGEESDALSYPVNEGDLIELIYSKDSSTSSGDDCAYVSLVLYDYDPGESEIPTDVPTEETNEATDWESEYNPYWDYPSIDDHFYYVETEFYYDDVNEYWYSNNHDDSSSTTFSVCVNTAGLISFEVLSSSEENCDRLIVYINGEEYARYSGTHYDNWIHVEMFVSTSDVVSFTYEKDSSVSYGSDCGYVRNFVYISSNTEEPTTGYESGEIGFENYLQLNYYNFSYEEVTDNYGNVIREYYSTNQTADSSNSINFAALTHGTLSFDYRTSSESNYDILTVTVNDSVVFSASGIYDYYSSFEIEVSTHDLITFTYSKDSSGNYGEDRVWVRNIMITPNEDYSEETDLPYQPEETDLPYQSEETTEPDYDDNTEIEFVTSDYFDTYDYEYEGTHTVWYTTNSNIDSSAAVLSFYAPNSGYITFDFTVSSERNCDLFYVCVNGDPVVTKSGNEGEINYRIDVCDNDYIEFIYQKDTSGYGGVDNVTITDITFFLYEE